MCLVLFSQTEVPTAGLGHLEVGWIAHAQLPPVGNEPVTELHDVGFRQSE
jgi:hypothetical protein